MRIIILLLGYLVASSAISATCAHNKVRLQILGSGGPEIYDKRASSSYLIWINNKAKVLIDAGGGSSFNFERSGARFEDLEVILFTHFHVDHSADLPVYIKASYFTRRKRDLLIYGPAGNRLMPSATEFVKKMLGSNGAFAYLSDYVTRSTPGEYHVKTENVPLDHTKIKTFRINRQLVVKAIATHHGPIAAIAWRVESNGCVISFSGDMSNRYNSLATLAVNSDILLAHNAIPEQVQGVARNLHMPPSVIGKIARRARVKKLVLSHRMRRTLGKEKQTRKIIAKYYSGPIIFGNDLDRISPRKK